MTTEIKLPQMGENLQGGEVVSLKVAVGDQVKAGQALLEVEAEKSTMEIPAPSAGRIAKAMVSKGDKIKTGQVLFLLEAGSGAAAPAAAETKTAAKTPAADEPKATKTAAAKAAGSPPVAPTAATPASAPAAVSPPTDGADKDTVVPAGPATRMLARKLGVDLAKVQGSQRFGRVTQEDVKAYVSSGKATPMAGAGIAIPPMPDFEKWGAVERKPVDSMRRATANQMSLAWSVIPHVTQHDLADITELEAFRREHDVQAKAGKGPKLTVTAFALKATAIALKTMPNFNASFDTAKGELIFKKYYHLGVAVDTERGLLVPVLRDVDKKSVTELAQELTEIAERARQKKITLDEMRGGTFTITNLGGIGGTSFTPIINYPEAAILGLSRGRMQPVYKDGAFVPRLMLPLSLSYDHRLIDGADAARFTRLIADMLEKPMLMLLHA